MEPLLDLLTKKFHQCLKTLTLQVLHPLLELRFETSPLYRLQHILGWLIRIFLDLQGPVVTEIEEVVDHLPCEVSHRHRRPLCL